MKSALEGHWKKRLLATPSIVLAHGCLVEHTTRTTRGLTPGHYRQKAGP